MNKLIFILVILLIISGCIGYMSNPYPVNSGVYNHPQYGVYQINPPDAPYNRNNR